MSAEEGFVCFLKFNFCQTYSSSLFCFFFKAWDWENDSIPLEPKGSGPPKFIAPGDKHTANEGDTTYVVFTVEGNPAPDIVWNKGFKDLSSDPRFKIWTSRTDDGENLVILGINQCRQDEEGDYKIILKNCNGEEAFEFKFFVTVEGGMDFRAMLLKRKKPAKKVAVLEYEWLETPIDVSVQEGKVDQVIFTARLSEKDKKGKWFLRNEETMKSNLALEYGVVSIHSFQFHCGREKRDHTFVFGYLLDPGGIHYNFTQIL